MGERLAAAALRLRYRRADGPAWLHPMASGGADTTPAGGSGAVSARVAFEAGTVQGGGLVLNASANACPRDDLLGFPPYPYYSIICAGFSAVVGAPAGRPSLPTRYTRLNGTALINGVALDTGSFTLPQAAARCEELAARGCVGFQVTNAPPPRDNATAAIFTFKSLADLRVDENATAWATFTPYGTYALPAAAAVAAEIKAFGCNASGAVGARGGAAAAPNDARNAAAALTAGGTAIYVDYAAGSDSADGSVAHPLKTVVAAVAASRGLAPGARPARVVLRNGTHYLNATISLGAADSGLRFEAFPGEAPVLSGALPLRALVWVQKNVTAAAPPGGPVQPNENNVFGECGRPGVPNKGVMADWQACQASCLADSTCTSWTYHNGTFNPGFTHVCWWVFGRLFSSAL